MVEEWVEGYVRAWNSNDPAEIGARDGPAVERLVEGGIEARLGLRP